MDSPSAFFEGAFPELFDRLVGTPAEDFHRTPREVRIPEPPALPSPTPKRRFSLETGFFSLKTHVFEDLPGGGSVHLGAFSTLAEAKAEKARLEAEAS